MDSQTQTNASSKPILLSFDYDDQGVRCWEFEDEGWISEADYDTTSQAYRDIIENHEFFEGWAEKCPKCCSSVEHCACRPYKSEESDESDEDEEDETYKCFECNEICSKNDDTHFYCSCRGEYCCEDCHHVLRCDCFKRDRITVVMVLQNVEFDLGYYFEDPEGIIHDVSLTVGRFLELENTDNIVAVFMDKLSGTVHLKSNEGPPRLIATFGFRK